MTSCPALEYLDLSECPQINDYCVELIAQNLKRLSTLKLANCPLVSDVALGFLAQYCKNLKVRADGLWDEFELRIMLFLVVSVPVRARMSQTAPGYYGAFGEDHHTQTGVQILSR